MLLESMAGMVSEALDVLTGEERNRIYGMLRLEVTPNTEGYGISDALCTSATRPAPAIVPGWRAPSRWSAGSPSASPMSGTSRRAGS